MLLRADMVSGNIQENADLKLKLPHPAVFQRLTGHLHRHIADAFLSVSYTHLDVYKRQESLSIASYPATRFHYQTALNEDTRDVDALVCQTDDYTFGLLILTPPDYYDDAAKAAADQLIASADLIYAERIDLAQTDYFDVLTPERWKYLCHYETTPTENGGYTLTYYNEDIPVLRCV